MVGNNSITHAVGPEAPGDSGSFQAEGKSQGEVSELVKTLQVALDEQSAIIDRLQGRLDNVLRPTQEEATSQDTIEVPTKTILGYSLYCLLEQVAANNRRINKIKDSLEN